MTGLILGNNEKNGSYQVGAYMALKKCNIKIDVVIGSGIGSFNGALIASCDEKKLYNLWEDCSLNELFILNTNKAKEILMKILEMPNATWSFKEIYKLLKNNGLDVSNYRALVRNQINEKKLRESNIKYGLCSIDPNTLEYTQLDLEDIPYNKLHDYIVTSSYFSKFDGYYLDQLFNDCATIYNIGCISITSKLANSKIININPKKTLDVNLEDNEDDIKSTMWHGYYDALRALKKIDGFDYYFKKKSNRYYKRLNHKIDKELFKTTSIILNSVDYKDTVLKALEYILRSERSNYLKLYKQDDIIKSVKRKTTDNIIYRYVKRLSIW